MATAAEATPRLNEEQEKELLALLEGADSAELKLTVAESDQPAVAYALGMDPVEAQIRQVFFFDTPDLTLNSKGVVVRARRVQGKGDDSVVKLRPGCRRSCRGRSASSPTSSSRSTRCPAASSAPRA